MVLDYDEETKMVTVQQRNFFKIGDQVEFFGPNIDNFTMTVKNLYDEEGNPLDAARHPLQIVRFQVDQPVYRYNLMRKENVHAV
jgi:putative protease